MRKRNKILLFFCFFLLVACQTGGQEEKQGNTVAVRDARGEKEVPFLPEKTAVLDFGHLDTLKEWGLEDRIVGTVTQQAPAYLADSVKEFEDVGTLKEPDIEKLTELQPDLIIISNRLADFATELERIAPVLLLAFDYENYWTSAQQNIRTLAAVFAKETEAEKGLEKLNEKIAEIKSEVPREEKALVLLMNDGSLSAFSAGSRFSFLFDTLGFQTVETPIERSTHGQSIGYEGILKINPDILFAIDRSKAVQQGKEENSALLDNAFIHKTAAYQKDQLIHLSPDLWYLSGGGLKSVQLMVEEIESVWK